MMKSNLLVVIYNLLVACVCSVNAAVFVWDGDYEKSQDPTWSYGDNWELNKPPAQPGDGTAAIVFSKWYKTEPYMEASYNILSLTFDKLADQYLLRAAEKETLTIQSGGIVNNALNEQFIEIGRIALGADQTWNAAFMNLYIGVLDGYIELASHTLTIDGTYNIALNSRLEGIGNLVKQGSGTLWLNNGNSFVGDLTINGGLVVATAAYSLDRVGTISVAVGSSLKLDEGEERICDNAELLLSGALVANNAYEHLGALMPAGGSIHLSDDTTDGFLFFGKEETLGTGHLTVYEWSGHLQGGQWYADGDRIFFGQKPSDRFLSLVVFDGYGRPGAAVRWDDYYAAWEIVPVPEPRDYGLLSGLCLVAFAACRRQVER